ncbi:transposase [Streptomyces sp. BBFR25]|uniref:transposase n=1 Tax=Streptomyces sp. BBFR25 TaxID=3372855 RepID=UPI0037DC5BC6
MAQWRLLARDAVVFPDVVAVACALADPRLQHLAAGGGRGQVGVRGAARGRSGGERVAAELGRRLGRPWLREVEAAWAGPLSVWAQAVARAHSRPVDAAPGPAQGWWVRSVHRPVEVAPGLRALVGSAAETGAGGAEPAVRVAGAGRTAGVVPRRSGHGGGLKRRGEQLFAGGLEQARAYVALHGHLALAHTGGRVGDGFDLGRWLAGRRVAAASLTAEQTAWLEELDLWWNPPWPLDWQRAWYRAREHVGVNGPVHGGDNLAGVPRRLERWLRHQITHYRELHEGQQQLLAGLGLGHQEVERFHAWPGRRRPAADGLAAARACVARHGHLAVSSPTTAADGFALGRWLAAQRVRQHTSGHLTRLARTLTGLDAWWNPPWSVQWQRMWWAARYRLAGLPEGCQWWPGAPETERSMTWLRRPRARRVLLHPGQQQLLDALPQHTGTQTSALTASGRREVSDQAWALICPLMPRQQSAGGRWREHRLLIDGIAHTARTDTPWREPAHYGPWQTCYRRYKRWLADGTLHQITALTLPTTDHEWQIAVARRLHRGS